MPLVDLDKKELSELIIALGYRIGEEEANLAVLEDTPASGDEEWMPKRVKHFEDRIKELEEIQLKLVAHSKKGKILT